MTLIGRLTDYYRVTRADGFGSLDRQDDIFLPLHSGLHETLEGFFSNNILGSGVAAVLAEELNNGHFDGYFSALDRVKALCGQYQQALLDPSQVDILEQSLGQGDEFDADATLMLLNRIIFKIGLLNNKRDAGYFTPTYIGLVNRHYELPLAEESIQRPWYWHLLPDPD